MHQTIKLFDLLEQMKQHWRRIRAESTKEEYAVAIRPNA
jgi:hypothetical protein